jgi:hypothetical protein
MTTDGPRAIETAYNGYRFRSRLEARWAVFFDALGIGYLYEHEGYVVGGVSYLCDFFIPEWAAWVEIKPNAAAIAEPQVMDKVLNLASATDKAAIIICGRPWPPEYAATYGFDGRICDEVVFHACRSCDGLWISGERGLRHLGGSNRRGAVPPGCIRGWPADLQDSELLLSAFRYASGARFEYGECPRGPRDH